MAGKVDRKARAARGKRAAQPKPAEELEILHPERTITVAGREITVREYGFVEGMTVRALAKPLTDAMYAHAQAGGAAPLFVQIQDVLDAHADMVVQLVARAADVEPEWIATLGDADGQTLLTTWWLVNSGFFIRPLLRRLALENLASPSAGDASTPPSSEPGSDPAPTSSAA